MKKWYSDCYRRHLLDMHIEDWDDRFLSEFDPEKYVENLKRAKIQAAMIYLQSHVGLCNFPTKVSRQHNAFKNNDKISRLIALLKLNDIKVVGYYSLIHNNYAEIDHPSWRMVDEQGRTEREKGGRYGFVCPNNPEYREFIVEQIKEMKAFANLDGMFYDMPFWPTSCRCSACKSRWQKEVGGDLPLPTTDDDCFDVYAKKLQEWMADFCRFVAEKTHEIMPDVSIEFNNAGVVAFDWSAGETERISDLADYAGGDLYGDLAAHSFSCKYFYAITQNQPFEYMNSRCVRLQEHTATKDSEYLETEIALTRAHHGATFLIDAIDPVGTMDERVYDLLGNIFGEQIALERYNKGELVSDVAVFFDSTTVFDKNNLGFGNKECAIAAVRRLSERHVPVSVIANGHAENLSKYSCIILPETQDFNNPEIEKFIDYVLEGGSLFFSGKGDNRLIARLLDGKFDGFTKSEMTYVSPKDGYESLLCDFNAKYPIPFKYKLPILSGLTDAEILATICLPYTDPKDNVKFASIHSNPPGVKTDIPAIVYRKVGKGQVVWSAGAIEKDERRVFGDMLVNLVKMMTKSEFTVLAKASKMVEIVTFKDDDIYYLGAVSLSADKMCYYPIEVRLKTESKPICVKDLSDGRQIPFEYADGYVCFCDEVNLYKSYAIEL